MQTETAVLNDLHRLEALFKKGYKSNLLGTAINKLMALEHSKTMRELQEIESRIREFEEKYTMDSESFEERFHSGLTDDSADSMEWISFIEMKEAILRKIRLLEENNQ